MRRCSVRLLLLAIVPLLLGPLTVGQPARGSATAPETAGAKILRVPWAAFPAHLDPHRAYGVEEAGGGLDYEGLTRIDAELNTVPGAAESWAFSADGLVLTFTLRPNLTYADGSPLTAERFGYAIERTCDPRTQSPYANILFDVVGCEAFATSLDDADDASAGPAADEAARVALGVRAGDDRKLEIRLTKPAAYLPTVASLWVFYPVKQEVVEADPERWWIDPANRVGNGPFRAVAIEPDLDRPRIAFAANERYWGGRPKLDGIKYVYFPGSEHTNETVEAYRRGELDMTWPWEELRAGVEADPALSRDLLRYANSSTSYIAFNLNREPFQDRKVREAFAYGFDRAAWCREIEFGSCTPTLSWIPPGSPGHIETDAFAFDPEQARLALAESSYGGPENLPEVAWYYPEGDREEMRDAEWLAAQYRAVLGIKLKLVPLAEGEWDAQYAEPATRPQLLWFHWTQDYPDPHNWLSVPWTCDSAIHAAEIGYCNPAFDELVRRADAELDPARRLALYDEAQRLLLADAPAVFLFNYIQHVLVKPHVVGYVVTPADFWPGWYTPLTIDIAPAA